MSEQEQGKSPETMDQKPSPKKKKRCFLASILPWKGDKFGEGLRKIILLAAIITLLVSGGKLLYETVYLPAQSDNAMNSIQQLYRPDGDSGDSQDDGSDTEANTEPARDDQGRLEKFLPLLEVNNDIKGWITVPNSKIDYPVLQSEKDLLLQPGENETYLYTDYQGNNTKYGSIFIDAHCDITNCKNIIIHGHHMRDGRMFANLMNYSDLSFYQSAPVITFDTIYEEAQWKVISIFKTNIMEDQGEPFQYLRYSFADDSDFLNYIYQVRERSLIDIPVDVNENDQLITLSTCSYEFDEFRTVVVARKVRPGEDAGVNVSEAVKNPDPLMPDVWYNTYGGSKPQVTTFEEALENGRIDWYQAPEEE